MLIETNKIHYKLLIIKHDFFFSTKVAAAELKAQLVLERVSWSEQGWKCSSLPEKKINICL